MSTNDETNLLLEKVEKHVHDKFVYMVQDFNEAGPPGVVQLEYMRGFEELYGPYSEMRSSIRRMNDSFYAGILGTASIQGRFKNSLLIKKHVVYERGLFNQDKPQGGWNPFGGGNNNDKNKEFEKNFQGMR